MNETFGFPAAAELDNFYTLALYYYRTNRYLDENILTDLLREKSLIDRFQFLIDQGSLIYRFQFLIDQGSLIDR